MNLYTYVLNNPLIYIDPTGHYCVSADGNWAHGGDCGSSSSIYLGDDSDFIGSTIIENGYITGHLGYQGNALPMEGNYWNINSDYAMIFKEHSLGYTIDAFYGNASEIPFFDDPLFIVADVGGLPKNIIKGVGKGVLKQATKVSVQKIAKEVAELGPNKINHILDTSHDWGKVVSNPNSWDEVSAIMSKVFLNGAEGVYKNVNMKVLKVGNEYVAVTYKKFDDGTVKISNGWVLYDE